MNYHQIATGILTVFVLSSSSILAEPWSPSCRNAIVKLERVQETVKAKQKEVKKAERGKRVRLEEAEICSSGGIITASRVVNCVRISREVPIVIQEVADARADLEPALEAFEEALDTLNRRCLEGQ